MKTILSVLVFNVLASFISAQNSPVKNGTPQAAFSIDAVITPARMVGSGNYLLSFSDKDFSTKNYIFYTDSNARVAHIRINGNDIRLTGGHNPENIMAYSCKGYTVTLKANNNQGTKVDATMVIYSGTQTVAKKVVGSIVNQ